MTSIRRIAVLIAAVATLGGFEPARALSVDEARHLLGRTGFGAAPHEMAALLPLDRVAAVDRIVAGLADDAPITAPPAFVRQRPDREDLLRLGDYAPAAMLPPGVRVPSTTPAEEDRLVKTGMQQMAQLRVWWLDQMVSTPRPQVERLALFWHNHFTSKYFDVLGARLMHDQLRTLRHWGARDFGGLLDAMLHDPAMLIFLDNAVSTRQQPNENFARELLELFTLGVGHYTQQDIREAARSLAGLSVDFGASWQYRFRPEAVDDGEKTVLGQRGRWGADDLRRILLAQPRTAVFLSEKFYREYVSVEPDAAEIERIAQVLREHDYAMAPFLRALWLSDGFWAARNRGQLVKGPVELLVGFVRSFGVAMPDIELLDSYAVLLGQQLFEPPTVAGWKGGAEWLDPAGMALREAMLNKLWQARDLSLADPPAAPGDLLVRLSGQVAHAGQRVPYTVLADGRVVARGRVRVPGNEQAEGLVRPKPAWETVRVPAANLPRRVRQVEVRFDKDSDDTALFVNWIEREGRRLPASQARTVWPAAGRCGEPGMLYCRAGVRFDLPRALVSADTAMLQDSRIAAVNSVVEYGTARVPLAMRPAGLARDVALRDTDTRFERLDGPALAQPWQRVTAVPPLKTTAAGPAATATAPPRVLTLDPVYHLK